ncbi:nucleotidyltransferase domain-containing protein [Rhodovibrio sodomensis]|uniref:nucleotidyltransferase domain-containing protein n=1 Tax=Rhodovibrio sodomensis TaxID=1088 RepID=UPI0019051ED2|nr:nucleotidyltransferase domain-containing protein [Rhodovibrio sodomensis]
MNELTRRRQVSSENIRQIVGKLERARGLCDGKACVYATGSYGRLEATNESDLDLFIVGLPSFEGQDSDNSSGGREPQRYLNRLDEIVVKADLIEAIKSLGLPDFDGDGEYLLHYTGSKLIKNLGTPEDDVQNTLTARLLLLLESQPLVGQDVYQTVVDDVVAKYWRDYEDHRDEFVPTFLVNDVMRLWRTFCVNYEARTKTEPEKQKVKRRVKNYKLKHNRMLTCFSAILSLLVKYRGEGTVHPQDFINFVNMTPTYRLEWVAENVQEQEAKDSV